MPTHIGRPFIAIASFTVMASLLSGCQSQSAPKTPQAPATALPSKTLTAMSSDTGYIYLSGKWEVLSITGKDGAPSGSFQSIEFTPDGMPVSTTVGENDDALQGNDLELWEYDKGWQMISVNGDDTVVKYGWSPAKELYAVPDDGQTMGIWYQSGGKWSMVPGSNTLGFINSIQWSPQGDLTVTSEPSDGSSSIWQYHNGHWNLLDAKNEPFAADGFQISWSPAGVLTLATSAHGVWQYQNGSWSQAGGVESPIHTVMQVGWSPKGTMVISGDAKGSTGMWELDNGQWSQVGGQQSVIAKDGIRQFGWSPSGVLTASDATTGRLYQLNGGTWTDIWTQLDAANKKNPVPVTFAWSPTGVLTCGGGALGGVWQDENGKWTQIGGANSPLSGQQPIELGWS